MEEQLEKVFKWDRLKHYVKDSWKMDELPDVKALLFLIGIQELAQLPRSYSKEEKQDLIHIGTCAVLLVKGYFEYEGRDADGWPHYRQSMKLPIEYRQNQENLLEEAIIQYFDNEVFNTQNN